VAVTSHDVLHVEENIAAAEAYLRLMGFREAYDNQLDHSALVMHLSGEPGYVYAEIATGWVTLYVGATPNTTMERAGRVRLTALPGPFMRKLQRTLEDAIDDARGEGKGGG
jgi:hypothetical protein